MWCCTLYRDGGARTVTERMCTVARYFFKSRSWRHFYRPQSKIVISHTASVTLTLVKFGNSLSWQDHLYVRGEGTDCFSLCSSFSMSLLLGETRPGDRESFGLLDRLECLTGVSLLELSMADRSSLSLLWPGDVERVREIVSGLSLRQNWPIIHS